MKTSISPEHIWRLMKNNAAQNAKQLKVVFLLVPIFYGLHVLFGGMEGLRHVADSILAYIGAASVFVPFVLYKDLFHPAKGTGYGMLPASQEEKYLSSFAICVLAVPLALILLAWILSLIGAALTGESSVMLDLPGLFWSNRTVADEWDFGFFDSFYWETIAIQSISFWGVYFFKTRKLSKTVLTFGCACLGLLLLFSIGAWSFSSHYYDEGLRLYMDKVGYRTALVTDIFFNILVPVGLWTWAYLKMKRQQF